MTLIASWVSRDNKPNDQNNISALYIGSDSRISWEPVGGCYDEGQKLFGCSKYPEIFAYCGDAFFPHMALARLIHMIDKGFIFKDVNDLAEKRCKVRSYIQDVFAKYPREQLIDTKSTILYGTRCNNRLSLLAFTYSQVALEVKECPPNEYGLCCAIGSGADDYYKNLSKHVMSAKTSADYNTSRALYHCLSKSIKETKRSTVGGAIQLIGLYRGNTPTNIYGCFYNKKPYFLGQEMNSEQAKSILVEWRNENFERVDYSGTLLSGAQAQPFTW